MSFSLDFLKNLENDAYEIFQKYDLQQVVPPMDLKSGSKSGSQINVSDLAALSDEALLNLDLEKISLDGQKQQHLQGSTSQKLSFSSSSVTNPTPSIKPSFDVALLSPASSTSSLPISALTRFQQPQPSTQPEATPLSASSSISRPAPPISQPISTAHTDQTFTLSALQSVGPTATGGSTPFVEHSFDLNDPALALSPPRMSAPMSYLGATPQRQSVNSFTMVSPGPTAPSQKQAWSPQSQQQQPQFSSSAPIQSPSSGLLFAYGDIVPSPPESATEAHDRLLFYAEYLRHRRGEVRLAAVLAIKKEIQQAAESLSQMQLDEYDGHDDHTAVWWRHNPSVVSAPKDVGDQLNQSIAPGELAAKAALLGASCETCAEAIGANLQTYQFQANDFLSSAVEVLSLMGPHAAPALQALTTILVDQACMEMWEPIVRCIMSIGSVGVESLAELSLDASSAWDAFVLSHLANHPTVQQHVMLPCLVKDLLNGTLPRRVGAAWALASMHERALPALPALLEALIAGCLDRRLIVKAIRATGDEGERLLVHVSRNNPSPRARACAAYALGLPRIANPDHLRVVVHTDFASSTAMPPLILHYPTVLPGISPGGQALTLSDLQHSQKSQQQPPSSPSSSGKPQDGRNDMAEDGSKGQQEGDDDGAVLSVVPSYVLFDSREMVTALQRLISHGVFSEAVFSPSDFASLPELPPILFHAPTETQPTSPFFSAFFQPPPSTRSRSRSPSATVKTPRARSTGRAFDSMAGQNLFSGDVTHGGVGSEDQVLIAATPASSRPTSASTRGRSPGPPSARSASTQNLHRHLTATAATAMKAHSPTRRPVSARSRSSTGAATPTPDAVKRAARAALNSPATPSAKSPLRRSIQSTVVRTQPLDYTSFSASFRDEQVQKQIRMNLLNGEKDIFKNISKSNFNGSMSVVKTTQELVMSKKAFAGLGESASSKQHQDKRSMAERESNPALLDTSTSTIPLDRSLQQQQIAIDSTQMSLSDLDVTAEEPQTQSQQSPPQPTKSYLASAESNPQPPPQWTDVLPASLLTRGEYKILQATHEVISALMDALGDLDIPVRLAAASSIGQVGLPMAFPAVPVLVACLRDPSEKVRSEAAHSLGKLGPEIAPNCIQDVIGCLKDEFWKVRFAACRTLGKFGPLAANLGALPPLLKALNDASIHRHEVAFSIVRMGTKGERALADTLQFSQQAGVQTRVACALGLGLADVSSPTIDHVVSCLFNTARDRLPLVRKAVLEALGNLSRVAGEKVTYLRSRSLLPFLYSFLKDKEKAVREAAAEVIAQAGPHGELLLIEGVLKDSSPVIRASAGYGLAHVGPRSIRTLLLALNDQDPMVRNTVAETIHTMGLNAIVSTLKARPRNQRDSVLRSAREILESPFPLPTFLEVLLANLITKLEVLAAQP